MEKEEIEGPDCERLEDGMRLIKRAGSQDDAPLETLRDMMMKKEGVSDLN